METKNTEKTNDSNDKTLLAYENETLVEDGSDKKIKENGIQAGFIVAAKKAGTKWNHLVKKRRVTRQYSKHPIDFNLGLDDDVGAFGKNTENNPSQRRLNKQLISHFANLAQHNDSEDEVDLDLIEELIKKGADVNCRDKHGQGMLHEAARAWHTDIVVFLLEQGAEVNMTDKFDRTPLHVAAAVDYPEMVEVLIDKGADIEAKTKDENQTPLHFSARNDAVESSKILVKLGADIEAKDYKQRTPIFVAAELDRSETARYLIEMDADVTVVDKAGQICMTHMITKMGPVARSALDQYHRKDRANRRQYFFLNLLEVPRLQKGDKVSLAKTPLEVIVNYRQLDLIMHPVIMRLIDVKWLQFGRRIAIRTLLLNLLLVLTWTILGVGYPWFIRPIYIFPQDGWRVFLLVLGCLLTAFEVFGEIKEILQSRKRFRLWKAWREGEINRDMGFCHPKWPEERKYLERELETLDELLPTYFQDFWNYLDWMVYLLIFFVVILHIADASLPASLRQAPCCTADFNCTNTSPDVCSTGIVNNASLSVWTNRFFVILIIFLWLRMMKFTRAFRFFGPFIVMLGKLTRDILRFLYLYLEFYIPYACAFWMIFGYTDTITSMSTVDQMLFSLFRITLVDDYQFDEMQAYDIVMAYILIGTFLGISAILCLNLFIALLSDTFQRVYDNANANAVMQQAALLLNFEENLSVSSKRQFQKFLSDSCNPECMYYDDDLTVIQDADLKKVTIQLKDQMDELMEIVNKVDKEKKYSEESNLSPRPGKTKAKTSTHIHEVLGLLPKTDKNAAAGGAPMANEAMQKVSNKMSEFTTRLQRLQVSQTLQEQSYKKLRDDLKDVKDMLALLIPGAQEKLKNQSSLFASPSINMSALTEQLIKPKSEQSTDTQKKSGFFGKLLGSQKGDKKAVSPRSDEVVPLPHFVPPTAFHSQRAGGISQSGGELISLHESTSSRAEGTPPSNQQPTIAGVRTADVTLRPPSDNKTSDSNA